MDLALPEIDGFAATFSIRTHEELRDVPIIAISAYGEGIDAQLKVDPESIGFNDYLPKPFSLQKLVEVLDRYLSGDAGRGDTGTRGRGDAGIGDAATPGRGERETR